MEIRKMTNNLPQDQLATQIRIRPASEADVDFIFNSWLKCGRQSQSVKSIQNEIYYYHQHKVIEGLLKTCTVLIACSAEDTLQIYGYLVCGKVENIDVIHFIYVKQAYRKLGIANLLLQSQNIDIRKPVFITAMVNLLFTIGRGVKKKYPLIYNPYLIYYAYAEADKESKHVRVSKRDYEA